MMRIKNAADAAFAKSWRKNNLKRDLIVGGASGPDLAVDGNVPNDPNAE